MLMLACVDVEALAFQALSWNSLVDVFVDFAFVFRSGSSGEVTFKIVCGP